MLILIYIERTFNVPEERNRHPKPYLLPFYIVFETIFEGTSEKGEEIKEAALHAASTERGAAFCAAALFVDSFTS